VIYHASIAKICRYRIGWWYIMLALLRYVDIELDGDISC
jgi:hypothetical protein